ncbi:hypothetical protein [Enterocloster asparagiformis]|uniref:hypothetical protein n=1 Tax=Enterocloster asparagiformis TaxID=333367 RepID=UPI000465AA12|nr:hypothetical protein [Enterocloster asparagiformis]
MADFKSLKNPDLIQAFHLVQYDPTPERQGEFMQEVVKARYLTAASFSPEPDVDEEGNLKFSEDATISFPDIHNDKGKNFPRLLGLEVHAEVGAEGRPACGRHDL